MNQQLQASESTWYFARAGHVTGPVPLSVVQHHIVTDQLGPDDVVRNVTWADWFRVADALGALGLSMSPQPVHQHVYAPHQTSTPAWAGGIGYAWFAPFSRRIASWFIDLVVLVGALVAINKVFDKQTAIASLVMVSFFCAYIVVLPSRRIGTLGHLMLNLEVVDAETGQRADAGSVCARGLMMLVLAVPLMLGVLLSIFVSANSPTATAWHDAATSTVVRLKQKRV